MATITKISFMFFYLCIICSLCFAELELTEHIVLDNFQGAVCIGAQDLDGDGDIDLAATSNNGNKIAWFENDGKQNYTEHPIINNFGQARVLDIQKVDSDEDYDIIATAFSDNKISWFENDGAGNFIEHVVVDDWVNASFVIGYDVDKDNDMDIVATACRSNKIGWFENDGEQNFTEHVLKENWTRANYADAEDMDLDGDIDIIGTAKEGDVIIFNNDGFENFTEDTVIVDWGGPSSVQAGDIDGDNDMDLAVTNCSSQEVVWFDNTPDGFIKKTIRTNFPGARSVNITDINFDGNVDILAVAWGTFTSDDNTAASIFFNDGEENFNEQIFSTNTYDLLKLVVTDLDDDDDLDIAGATFGHDEIRWWENNLYKIKVGANIKSGHLPLTVNFTDSSTTSFPKLEWGWDFDGDGIIDSEEENPTYIYEQPGSYDVTFMVSDRLDTIQHTFENYIRVFNGESAMLFNENTDTVMCPASTDLSVVDAFTFEACIFPQSFGFVNVFGEGRIFNKSAIDLYLNKDDLAQWKAHSMIVEIRNADGHVSKITTPDSSIKLNEWQHVAVTYDSAYSELKIFINGLEQELSTIYSDMPTGNLQNNNEEPLILGNNKIFSRHFDGKIDEVRLWSVALSPEQINERISQYLTGYEENLMGYWSMNEGAGDLISDLSGNENNFIIVNTEWDQGVDLSQLVGIKDTPYSDGQITNTFTLSQNYPNPFNPETTINFFVRKPGNVKLNIYNVSGQRVRVLIDKHYHSGGDYSVKWDGTNNDGLKVSSGIYFCRLNYKGNNSVKKMILVR